MPQHPTGFYAAALKRRGTCAALSLLPHSCSCCGQPPWHSEQSHATHPGFAQTNELAQTADKHTVYNLDNGEQKDLLEHDLLRAAFSRPSAVPKNQPLPPAMFSKRPKVWFVRYDLSPCPVFSCNRVNFLSSRSGGLDLAWE